MHDKKGHVTPMIKLCHTDVVGTKKKITYPCTLKAYIYIRYIYIRTYAYIYTQEQEEAACQLQGYIRAYVGARAYDDALEVKKVCSCV